MRRVTAESALAARVGAQLLEVGVNHLHAVAAGIADIEEAVPPADLFLDFGRVKPLKVLWSPWWVVLD